jgi:hypothetical protein
MAQRPMVKKPKPTKTTTKKSGNTKKTASKFKLITSLDDIHDMKVSEFQAHIQKGDIDLDNIVDYNSEPYTNKGGKITHPIYPDGSTFVHENAAQFMGNEVLQDFTLTVLKLAAYKKDHPTPSAN